MRAGPRIIGALLMILLVSTTFDGPVEAQQAAVVKLPAPSGGPRRAPSPGAATTWYFLFDIKDAVTKQQIQSVPATIAGPGPAWTGPVRLGLEMDQSTWVGPFTPGTYRVELRHPSYAVAAATFTLEPSGVGPFSAKRITWPLQPSAQAKGILAVTVTDATTRRPIGAATVSVSGMGVSRSEPVQQAAAVFRDLPLGAYTFSATAPGYQPASAQVNVAEGGKTTFQTVALNPGGAALRVTVRDERGQPVSGARVSALGSAGRAEATTDPSGAANLALSTGEFVVTASAPGYQPGPQIRIALPRPEGVQIQMVRQQRALQVTVRDDRGQPVAGALVRATGPHTAEARSDGAGVATLTLPYGVYDLAATAPGHMQSGVGRVDVAVYTSVPITLKRDAAQLVAFRVTVADERGQPIPGASVRVMGQSPASAPPLGATTDAAGVASFTLALEDYTIVVEAPGRERKVISNVRAAHIKAGSLHVGGLSRTTGIPIQVRVRDDRGPVAGATVKATGPAGTFTGIADAAGVATLTLPSAGFTFSVEAQGHSPAARERVSVLEVERTGLDIYIQRVVAGELEVLVTTERANKVIPGAAVTVGSLKGVTDARGRVVLNTGPGKFRVTVQAPGYLQGQQGVSVFGRESVWIDLQRQAAEPPSRPPTQGGSGTPVNAPFGGKPLSQYGQKAVYYSPQNRGAHGWRPNGSGFVGTSDGPNLVVHFLYFTYDLPRAASKVTLAFRGGRVVIDPQRQANISGGGLGLLVYAGAASPAGAGAWGQDGGSVWQKYWATRPDWNRDLAPETFQVTLPQPANRITVALALADSWGGFPVEVAANGLDVRIGD